VEALFTIGFTRKSLEQFITLLQEAEVDAVVDVRRHNTSQLAGFAKRDDLAYLLRKGFRIEYEHVKELAPPPELLSDYQRSRDWESYAAAFRQLILTNGMLREAAPILDRYRRPCLLCSEDEPERCHRSLLAEALQAADPKLEVKHLRWETNGE
jgi:uncharacterized protein (DUF488 family)